MLASRAGDLAPATGSVASQWPRLGRGFTTASREAAALGPQLFFSPPDPICACFPAPSSLSHPNTLKQPSWLPPSPASVGTS